MNKKIRLNKKLFISFLVFNLILFCSFQWITKADGSEKAKLKLDIVQNMSIEGRGNEPSVKYDILGKDEFSKENLVGYTRYSIKGKLQLTIFFEFNKPGVYTYEIKPVDYKVYEGEYTPSSQVYELKVYVKIVDGVYTRTVIVTNQKGEKVSDLVFNSNWKAPNSLDTTDETKIETIDETKVETKIETTGEITKEKNPNTGDQGIFYFIVILVVSLIGFVIIKIKNKKN